MHEFKPTTLCSTVADACAMAASSLIIPNSLIFSLLSATRTSSSALWKGEAIQVSINLRSPCLWDLICA